MGSCVYEIDPGYLRMYTGTSVNEEIPGYTQAFFDARETAMDRLAQDLFREWPPGHTDSPVGVVGMTVEETTHAVTLAVPAGGFAGNRTAVVEYTAVGTAVAMLAPNDPRRAKTLPAPSIVVPLDR
jgi:uncharacterized protein YbjQ (UPF0145 family)